jgi:hypothetical protein
MVYRQRTSHRLTSAQRSGPTSAHTSTYCVFFARPLESPIPNSYTRAPPRYAAYNVVGTLSKVLKRTFVPLGVNPTCWLLVHQLYAVAKAATSLIRACATPAFAFLDENPSRCMTGLNSQAPVAIVGRVKSSVRIVL